MPPSMNRKLFNQLSNLGSYLETHHRFHPDIVKAFEAPYRLSRGKVQWYRFLGRIGFMDLSWNRMMKANDAYARRLDRPYR